LEEDVLMGDDDGWKVWAVLFWGGLFFILIGWNDDGWVGKARYALSYQVSPSQVHISHRPIDCDWSYAPMGRKGCTYQAEVTARNAAGYMVGEDTPTKRITDDDGKTVTWPAQDTKVTSVEVRWMKKFD
jgi:hypothetical protein